MTPRGHGGPCAPRSTDSRAGPRSPGADASSTRSSSPRWSRPRSIAPRARPRGIVAGAVVALPVLEARGLDFDLVFVIGLNDGIFPSYHPDDPLLPDEVKLALNRPLGEALRRRFGANAPSRAGAILRTRYERNGEDFLLFFLALSMPSRRVVLSYAAAEAGGNPMVRSPFVDEVLRLLGDPGGNRGGKAHLRLGRHPHYRRVPLARRISRARRGRPYARVPGGRDDRDARDARLDQRALGDRARPRDVSRDADARRICRPRRPGDALLAEPGQIRARGRCATGAWRRMRAWRGCCAAIAEAPRTWSATKLGELAACGFKFFAHRVLALSDDEEQDYELSRARGRRIDPRRVASAGRANRLQRPSGARAHALEVLKAVRDERRPLARDQGFFDLRWRSIERTATGIHRDRNRLSRGTSRSRNPDRASIPFRARRSNRLWAERPRARAAMAGGHESTAWNCIRAAAECGTFACSTTRIRATPTATASWRIRRARSSDGPTSSCRST